MFLDTGEIYVMADVMEEAGQVFCWFRDSVYPIHSQECILKAPAEGNLTQLEHRYNVVLSDD